MESFLFRARRSTQIAVFVLIVFSQIGLAPAQTVSAAPEPRAQPPAPLAYHALPSVGLTVPSQVLLGSDVNFTVTFDNTGTDATDIGYGPFIDLIIPVPGADGVYPGTPAANAYDGLGLTTISASYLGVPFVTSGASQNMWVLTFNGSGNATHPLVRDSSGNYVTVTGTPGAKLVVLKLPFGSFTPDQPAATVDISVDMSNLADVGTPLTIQARGGYQFGYTPLDDFCCGDTPPVTSFVSKDVTPSIWTLSKTYAGPENEAASGPNFRTFYPEQYTVTATIAPGQSVTALTLTDTVPDNLQFYSLISTSPGGASCSTPSTSSPGGTLICTFAGSVSGSASMTFDFYIPLNDASAAAVIDPTTGTTVAPPTPISVTSCNNASASASWTPIDTRDTALPLSEDPAGCEHTLSDKSLAVQKSSTIVGGGSLAPKKVVEYTLNFQVSDFFALDNVQLTDVLSDGQRLDTSFTPTLAVSGNGYSFAAVGMDPANYDINCYYTTAKVTTTGVTPGTECETNPGSNSGNSDQYGTTQIVFKISDELVTQGQSSVLFGGCVDPSSAATPLNCDPSSGGYNDGPTYGTITFRAIVQEKFSDNFPSGDDSVDQGDVLTNIGKYVQGDVQDLTDRPVTGTGSTATDDSSVTLNIATGTMSKSIYAINGITDSNSWPKDSNGKVKVTPGDTVTYRIQYDLPIG
ncbi:MAG: hypothetical protein HY258_10225, partial [Chloroflexi bacterium]|nr:hypothetical protein [Chloroflexota bacterium]